MSNAQDLFLASLVRSYDPPAPQEEQKKRKAPAAKVTVTVAAPEPLIPQEAKGVNPLRQGDNDQSAALPVLPMAGTHDARSFQTAMNHATDRASKMQAIAGFIGYNVGEPYGPQEAAALFAARKALRGIPVGQDRSVVRSAQQTAQGFVAGMPDNLAKQIQDLLGRERLAASTMGDLQKVSQDEKQSDRERAAARLAIRLEEERLTHVRAELRRLGYQFPSVQADD